MRLLDDEAREALAEAFNLALGEAVASLVGIVPEDLQIEVPKVEILPRDALMRELQGLQAPAESARLCRIAQHFHAPTGAPLKTEVALLLPEPGGLAFARRLLGDASTVAGPLSELEQDVLAEVANLLLNGATHRLSKVLGRPLVGSLPEWRAVSPAEGVGSGPDSHAPVMTVHLALRLRTRELRGCLLFLMDAPALEASIGQIRRFFGLEALETL
jgi:chemotaxis protein CheC